MSEKVCVFGRAAKLTGILSEPGQQRVGAPAVLLWNVGFHHRIGPFRIFVDLARRAAQLGLPALRFDVSGLGDSEVRKDALGDLERAAADVREAMDYLTERSGIDRFVLVGFCSSVDAAHTVAVSDPRVVGVAYIEGYAYPSLGFWMHYPRRFLHPVRWERYLGQKLPRLFPRARKVMREAGGPVEVYRRDYPTPERFGRDLLALAAREVRVLALYVGGDTGFNHHEQFYEMCGAGLRGKVELEYYDDADHTFFQVHDRLRMLDRLCSWFRTFVA